MPSSPPCVEPRVRYLRQSDFQHGLADCLRALSDCPDLDSSSASHIQAQRKRRGVLTLVALVGRQVVGTASFFLEPKFLHGGSWAGHVEDVAVHPAFQAHGIGTLLVERIIAICRQRGCYKIILDCDQTVAPFYARLGFYHNGSCMRLDLPGGP